jgi:hypothetical protein
VHPLGLSPLIWRLMLAKYVQDDSKLLSELSSPIIFKNMQNKIKLLMEYETVTHRVLLTTELNTANF